ncbi:hypothetical protein HF086_016479 [Spodoptera exigua]|uniref:Uncharacterized protein n=1 Tax=Spodoptera exigua TaxID=7107 RepID=A0A922MW99_SPOEX|nr:hypothetical protein HF086_016479 [Spodoptera exigua]
MGAQSPPMMTSPHGYSEALKRNLQGMMEDCNLSYMSGEDHMMQSEDYPSSHDDYSRPPILNGYGSSSSSHDVKAEDLTSDPQDVKPNIYALKNEMQASDYSNKDLFQVIRNGVLESVMCSLLEVFIIKKKMDDLEMRNFSP